MNHLTQTSLWTAIVTPLLKNTQIDFESFQTLLKRQEDAGNGVVILGSTGEGLALSNDEKKSIVRFTCELNLKTPIMVGVGGFNLTETLDWLSFCEEQKGISSYLMPTPLYAKPGVQGQTLWFKALLDHVKKPCMLYNVPSRTGVKLYQEVVNSLKDHSNFWALKEASGSLKEFQLYQEAAPNIALYSGEDALVPQFSYFNLKGLVSVMSNVWPAETNAYVKQCLSGNIKGLYPTWQNAADSLFTVSNPIPAKVMLYQQGIIKCPNLRAPLTHLELKETSALMEADKQVQNWFQKLQGVNS